MAKALKRGIARYQTGTDDVKYPASGLKSDLSNAVMRGGFLTAPGDPNATIAARQAGYAAKAQADPAWAQQWGINPQTGVSNDERYLAAKAAIGAGATPASTDIRNLAQAPGAPGGALQIDRQPLITNPADLQPVTMLSSSAMGVPSPPVGGSGGLPSNSYQLVPSSAGPGWSTGSTGHLRIPPVGSTLFPYAGMTDADRQSVLGAGYLLGDVALRRGIAGYANGTPDVQYLANGGDVQPPVSTPSGAGQLLTGDFAAAQRNPESAPATAAVAGFLDYLGRANRAARVATPPSSFEKLANLFTGNQASTAAIAQREQAAKAFSDPVVQQHLMTDPVALRAAETDPLNYSKTVQDLNFRDYMQRIQKIHAQMQGGVTHTDATGTIGPHTPADPHQLVRTVATTGISPAQALAVHEPHQYTRDEYIRVMSGMPTKIAQTLLEAQLRSAQIYHMTPQQQVTADYVNDLRNQIATETDPAKRQVLLQNYRKQAGTIAGAYQRFMDIEPGQVQ